MSIDLGNMHVCRRDELRLMVPSLMDAVLATKMAAAARVPCGTSAVRIDVESCGSSTWHNWQHQVACENDGQADGYDKVKSVRRKLRDNSSGKRGPMKARRLSNPALNNSPPAIFLSLSHPPDFYCSQQLNSSSGLQHFILDKQ